MAPKAKGRASSAGLLPGAAPKRRPSARASRTLDAPPLGLEAGTDGGPEDVQALRTEISELKREREDKEVEFTKLSRKATAAESLVSKVNLLIDNFALEEKRLETHEEEQWKALAVFEEAAARHLQESSKEGEAFAAMLQENEALESRDAIRGEHLINLEERSAVALQEAAESRHESKTELSQFRSRQSELTHLEFEVRAAQRDRRSAMEVVKLAKTQLLEKQAVVEEVAEKAQWHAEAADAEISTLRDELDFCGCERTSLAEQLHNRQGECVSLQKELSNVEMELTVAARNHRAAMETVIGASHQQVEMAESRAVARAPDLFRQEVEERESELRTSRRKQKREHVAQRWARLYIPMLLEFEYRRNRSDQVARMWLYFAECLDYFHIARSCREEARTLRGVAERWRAAALPGAVMQHSSSPFLFLGDSTPALSLSPNPALASTLSPRSAAALSPLLSSRSPSASASTSLRPPRRTARLTETLCSATTATPPVTAAESETAVRDDMEVSVRAASYGWKSGRYACWWVHLAVLLMHHWASRARDDRLRLLTHYAAHWRQVCEDYGIEAALVAHDDDDEHDIVLCSKEVVGYRVAMRWQELCQRIRLCDADRARSTAVQAAARIARTWRQRMTSIARTAPAAAMRWPQAPFGAAAGAAGPGTASVRATMSVDGAIPVKVVDVRSRWVRLVAAAERAAVDGRRSDALKVAQDAVRRQVQSRLGRETDLAHGRLQEALKKARREELQEAAAVKEQLQQLKNSKDTEAAQRLCSLGAEAANREEALRAEVGKLRESERAEAASYKDLQRECDHWWELASERVKDSVGGLPSAWHSAQLQRYERLLRAHEKLKKHAENIEASEAAAVESAEEGLELAQVLEEECRTQKAEAEEAAGQTGAQIAALRREVAALEHGVSRRREARYASEVAHVVDWRRASMVHAWRIHCLQQQEERCAEQLRRESLSRGTALARLEEDAEDRQTLSEAHEAARVRQERRQDAVRQELRSLEDKASAQQRALQQLEAHCEHLQLAELQALQGLQLEEAACSRWQAQVADFLSLQPASAEEPSPQPPALRASVQQLSSSRASAPLPVRPSLQLDQEALAPTAEEVVGLRASTLRVSRRTTSLRKSMAGSSWKQQAARYFAEQPPEGQSDEASSEEWLAEPEPGAGGTSDASAALPSRRAEDLGEVPGRGADDLHGQEDLREFLSVALQASVQEAMEMKQEIQELRLLGEEDRQRSEATCEEAWAVASMATELAMQQYAALQEEADAGAAARSPAQAPAGEQSGKEALSIDLAAELAAEASAHSAAPVQRSARKTAGESPERAATSPLRLDALSDGGSSRCSSPSQAVRTQLLQAISSRLDRAEAARSVASAQLAAAFQGSPQLGSFEEASASPSPPPRFGAESSDEDEPRQADYSPTGQEEVGDLVEQLCATAAEKSQRSSLELQLLAENAMQMASSVVARSREEARLHLEASSRMGDELSALRMELAASEDAMSELRARLGAEEALEGLERRFVEEDARRCLSATELQMTLEHESQLAQLADEAAASPGGRGLSPGLLLLPAPVRPIIAWPSSPSLLFSPGSAMAKDVGSQAEAADGASELVELFAEMDELEVSRGWWRDLASQHDERAAAFEEEAQQQRDSLLELGALLGNSGPLLGELQARLLEEERCVEGLRSTIAAAAPAVAEVQGQLGEEQRACEVLRAALEMNSLVEVAESRSAILNGAGQERAAKAEDAAAAAASAAAVRSAQEAALLLQAEKKAADRQLLALREELQAQEAASAQRICRLEEELRSQQQAHSDLLLPRPLGAQLPGSVFEGFDVEDPQSVLAIAVHETEACQQAVAELYEVREAHEELLAECDAKEAMRLLQEAPLLAEVGSLSSRLLQAEELQAQGHAATAPKREPPLPMSISSNGPAGLSGLQDVLGKNRALAERTQALLQEQANRLFPGGKRLAPQSASGY
eukprot:TRINITY_DN51397_c0_g1_i1.p1 TRINITY_DN51397_c0_g1~~TRINITY_DN51397_c0_g1_i1.p1  ORF type:complete len:1962 (+),score=635.85 TRINITY_DN51397_c0_g1_i1:237-6122(+)